MTISPFDILGQIPFNPDGLPVAPFIFAPLDPHLAIPISWADFPDDESDYGSEDEEDDGSDGESGYGSEDDQHHFEEGMEDDELETNMHLERQNEEDHIARLFSTLDAEEDEEIRLNIIDSLIIELFLTGHITPKEFLDMHPRPDDMMRAYFPEMLLPMAD